LTEIDRAICLNPNDFSNLCIKAWILNFAGHPEEALVCRDQTLRLNPLAPMPATEWLPKRGAISGEAETHLAKHRRPP
jgi:hypothetical protein